MEMKCGLVLLLNGLTWADSENVNSVQQQQQQQQQQHQGEKA